MGDIRGHFSRPSAICSMRLTSAADGVHWPPRAINRVLVSVVPARRAAAARASASSTRACAWRSCCVGSNVPSRLKVNILNTERMTRTGRPWIISTATSAQRTRWPAKRVSRKPLRTCSMRSRDTFGSRYRAPSRSSKKYRSARRMESLYDVAEVRGIRYCRRNLDHLQSLFQRPFPAH